MADASIIDIGGVQWNIKDKQARNDIETIKQLLTVEILPKIDLTLNDGYSAITPEIRQIQKYGKLYMGLLFIDNLSGQNIGTNEIVNISQINISLKQTTYAVGIDYLSSKPIRASISRTGIISFQETAGITDGDNRLRVPITWIEA